MRYHNPIIPGFYPDPSICRVKDTYYLVTSSFEYFPGIPIFKSKDLINWKSIGSVLTTSKQLPLQGSDGHGGIYAPTIRYYEGKFYVVSTNVDHGGHFYVTSSDPEKGWSDPIYVAQEGIDPSLFFDDGKAYFLSTAQNEGKNTVLLSELNLKTGEVSDGQYIWYGNGGRYLEGPHLYKINDWYYLLASEGGTEYGHMLVVARSKKIFGPYESCPHNPILTNRDLGGYQLQGAGHGDFVQDQDNNWWVVFLAFRQLDKYMQYHTLGREVNLLPVNFENDWPIVGDGRAHLIEETDRLNIKQKKINDLNQNTAQVGKDIFFLRNPQIDRYKLSSAEYVLKSSEYFLGERDASPTVVLSRQRSFSDQLEVVVDPQNVIAGITAYLEPDQHYDLLLEKENYFYKAKVRLVIGPTISVARDYEFKIKDGLYPKLKLRCSNQYYQFQIKYGDKTIDLGKYAAQYLSSEVAGDFTGVMLGLFVEKINKPGKAIFRNFKIKR